MGACESGSHCCCCSHLHSRHRLHSSLLNEQLAVVLGAESLALLVGGSAFIAVSVGLQARQDWPLQGTLYSERGSLLLLLLLLLPPP